MLQAKYLQAIEKSGFMNRTKILLVLSAGRHHNSEQAAAALLSVVPRPLRSATDISDDPKATILH